MTNSDPSTLTAPSSQSLDDWLDFISAAHPSEIDMGLARVSAVWSKLAPKHPLAKRVVTVAGTNGKGSTIAMIETVLLDAGLSVGCYTSPHIQHYNERIRIAKQDLSDAEIIASFKAVEAARGDTPLTYFEYSTLASLWALADAKLDVVLLEVGLGGRLDAVNIVDADIAIITSIALDHADWLGTDLAQIGREKAGIMRAGQPVLIGQDVTASVAQCADDLACPAWIYGREFSLECNAQGEQLSFAGRFAELAPLLWSGSMLPSSNVVLAWACCYLLAEHFQSQLLCDTQALQARLDLAASTSVPGRLEQVSSVPAVYLDVGHNAQAASHLSARIKQLRTDGQEVYAVYSSLLDKDAAELAQILSVEVDHWCLAQLDCPRAMPLPELEKLVGQSAQDMLSFASIGAALDKACALANKRERGSDIVLVFGSFFVVEAAKAYFQSYE